MNIKPMRLKYRFDRYLDPKVSHSPFSFLEDKLILDLVNNNKCNWTKEVKKLLP